MRRLAVIVGVVGGDGASSRDIGPIRPDYSGGAVGGPRVGVWSVGGGRGAEQWRLPRRLLSKVRSYLQVVTDAGPPLAK